MTSNIYDLADVWNDAGTTFTAIKMNVTDTASNAASLLMDLQVGGVSRFRTRKDGSVFAETAANTGIWLNDSSVGAAPGFISFMHGGTRRAYAWGKSSGELELAATNNQYLTLTATLVGGHKLTQGSASIFLYIPAANVLEQRTGANAQTFRLYETYTDASNYSRGYLSANSTAVTLGSEAAGTGTKRNVVLDGANRATYSETAADIAAALVAHGIMAPA